MNLRLFGIKKMNKRTICTMLAAALVLTGCGLNDYKEEISNATVVADKVVNATKDLAGDVADAAGIDKSQVKENLKNATEGIKEQAKEAASDITDKAVDASKDIVKDYAKKTIEEMAEEAIKSIDDSTEKKLNDTSDIGLTDTDGAGTNYTFEYGGRNYTAIYTPDNWKIRDSYRIQNSEDMLIICQGLIDEHPVHGKDLVSFRTAEDMVYEWKVHNLAYEYLEDDDPLKSHVTDVDFDPKDQGITIEEFYKSRTGKDLDVTEFLTD